MSMESDSCKAWLNLRRNEAASARPKLPMEDENQPRYASSIWKLTYTGSKRHDTFWPLLVLGQFQPVEAVVISTVKPMALNVGEPRQLFQRPLQFLQREIQGVIVDLLPSRIQSLEQDTHLPQITVI